MGSDDYSCTVCTAGGGLIMTADEIAYDELCISCIDEKRCHDNPVDCCDRYIARVEELENEE